MIHHIYGETSSQIKTLRKVYENTTMSKTKSNKEYESEYIETFARRLEEMRCNTGISARDMSLSLGQNPGYINNIENRKSLPSLLMFLEICEYLDVSPSYFMSIYDKDVHSIKYKEFMNMASRLTPQQFDALFTLLQDLTKRRLP